MTDVVERPRKRQQAAPKDDPTLLLRHRGKRYIEFLVEVMQIVGAATYFEIGTRRGMSLAGANCKCVAVDPAFMINSNVIHKKPVTMLFQMGSDRFFESYNLTTLLGGPAEVCFLDGFHVFEFLLRDFINTEKHCKRNSLVFLHDCLPSSFLMTDRRKPGNREEKLAVAGWTGDVWKVVPILQKYRPDLKIYAVDCPPTGLIMITGLDPSSSVLENRFFDIIEEFRESEGDVDRLKDYIAGTTMLASREINDLSDLGKYTW